MKQNLIKKLQMLLESQSINRLKNLYLEDIMEWLDISDSQAMEIVTDLHEKRIITYKYSVMCSCGERCTIYEQILMRQQSYFCEICGNVISLNDIEKQAVLVLEIDKQELLKMGKNKISYMIIPRSTKNVILKQEEKKMEIFIGSSSEAVSFMDEIACKLEALGETPLLWNDSGKGIFVPGESTMDSLIAITERVKAAVFIFNADDKTWNEKSMLDSMDTVRDNVLFEYGLFMGALGKKNVCFVCKGNPKIASDLKGITYIDGDQGDSNVKMKLRDWIGAMSESNAS